MVARFEVPPALAAAAGGRVVVSVSLSGSDAARLRAWARLQVAYGRELERLATLGGMVKIALTRMLDAHDAALHDAQIRKEGAARRAPEGKGERYRARRGGGK